MRLHLIILAALIAVTASETIDICEKFCENGYDEASQYCILDKDCYRMIPKCTIEGIKCALRIEGNDPKEYFSLFEDNCKDKKLCVPAGFPN